MTSGRLFQHLTAGGVPFSIVGSTPADRTTSAAVSNGAFVWTRTHSEFWPLSRQARFTHKPASWHAVLLEPAEDTFIFGAPATVIADLGEVPADREHFYEGDPVWGELLSRIEVAGYDAGQDMFYNELVPLGMWMRYTYLPPQSGRSLSDLWNGQMIEID